MAPILFQHGPVTREYDPAGINVLKRVLPIYHTGYYTSKRLPNHMRPVETRHHDCDVPPLQYFCLKMLYASVDAVDLGGRPRFMFDAEVHMAWLKWLIPFITRDMKYVDPRLWATLIQLYSGLPLIFHTYTLPLSDTHLTQLQAIRSTSDFTLITVLDLSARPEVCDETIGQLKPLGNLCVLDLSLTRVGSWGVRKLAMCLVGKRDERIGPWRVRVWSLRGCKRVDHTVMEALVKFPLLSAVDLRDTSVRPSSHLPGFSTHPHTTFYYPNPPLSWINGLCASFPDCQIFQSCAKGSFHFLHINTLEYPEYVPPSEDNDRKGDSGALFPRGRRGQYIQDSEEAGHDGYGEFPEHSGMVAQIIPVPADDHLGHCRSEGDHSESGLSEEIVPEGEATCQLSVPAFSNVPLVQGQDTDASPGIVQENKVAAIVAARIDSERKAVQFYSKRGIRDWESGRRVQMDMGRAARLAEMHKPVPQPPPTDVQWSLMFYREPPAYDSISHEEDAPPYCHTVCDQPVLAKKRKTGPGPAGIPKVLLCRQRTAGALQQGQEGCLQGSTKRPPRPLNPFLVNRAALP